MNRTIALMVAASAVAFAASANAYEFKPYVGLDYTFSQVKNNMNDDLNSGTVVVGTNYNEYFGTELFYQFSDSQRNSLVDEDESYNYEQSMRAYGLDLYGYLPMGCMHEFALVGTTGIANIDQKIKVTDAKRFTENGLGYRLGAGVQYNINDNVSVRALARYTWTDKLGNREDGTNTDHIMEYTLGARYTF